jgi:hypothetical protein
MLSSDLVGMIYFEAFLVWGRLRNVFRDTLFARGNFYLVGFRFMFIRLVITLVSLVNMSYISTKILPG